MVSPSDSMLQNQQGKYVRARDNPFFDGLRRGNTSIINRASLFGNKQKVGRSASVIGHKGEYTDDIQENVSYSSSKGSRLDIESIIDLGSSQIADGIQSDRVVEHKSFISDVNKRKQTHSGILLPPCAASFYYGNSPPMDVVESCLSIQQLNVYLKASKDAVYAGVPGRFLRAVLGHVLDAGSFISTIMYSFYLNETDKSSQYCTVPVINMKRVDLLNSHAELEWLLNSCNIDQTSLLFIDEVDLSYYDLFGSLKVVLLNADKLPEKQEALKESVVEIFNCEKNVSCCAVIAEKFASTSPKILAGKGFSRLLLAGILLDTKNLTSPECTSVDKYMSTLLLNGAGRFGCNGLYQILRSKMHDVSQLSVGQILKKDFRKWTRTDKGDIGGSRLVVSDVGMSAAGISVPQLLSRDETAIQEIILFQQLEKLRLLIIVSGYDHYKNVKEMLISAESGDLMKDLLHFLDSHASHLPLYPLYQPGLSDEMRAFTISNVTSMSIMEQLLQDFFTTQKGKKQLFDLLE